MAGGSSGPRLTSTRSNPYDRASPRAFRYASLRVQPRKKASVRCPARNEWSTVAPLRDPILEAARIFYGADDSLFREHGGPDIWPHHSALFRGAGNTARGTRNGGGSADLRCGIRRSILRVAFRQAGPTRTAETVHHGPACPQYFGPAS